MWVYNVLETNDKRQVSPWWFDGITRTAGHRRLVYRLSSASKTKGRFLRIRKNGLPHWQIGPWERHDGRCFETLKSWDVSEEMGPSGLSKHWDASMWSTSLAVLGTDSMASHARQSLCHGHTGCFDCRTRGEDPETGCLAQRMLIKRLYPEI